MGTTSSKPTTHNEDDLMLNDPDFIADIEASEFEIDNGKTRKWKDFKWKV